MTSNSNPSEPFANRMIRFSCAELSGLRILPNTRSHQWCSSSLALLKHADGNLQVHFIPSMSRAQLKVAGDGWVDDTTLQLARRQAERR